ncbi:hypothetical protein [Chitinophaga filiformis]|uniref:Uncharacterized protein n=1 Tax=Chitinophaga filiformis TaxID=104663 RepID=A0ABY4HSZ9_CHIFI|nr:hypothetical protein [Chitinophaga filiformis]UPK66903.1 hypothetical protein MYF79_18350 [Chitinophaga filiformis]
MKALPLEQQKIGFQQVSRNENVLVLQRIINKNIAKKRKKRGDVAQQPTLNLHLFDQRDLEELRELQAQIVQNYPTKSSRFFYPILQAIGTFLTK